MVGETLPQKMVQGGAWISSLKIIRKVFSFGDNKRGQATFSNNAENIFR